VVTGAAVKYTFESELQGSGTNALLKNNQPEGSVERRIGPRYLWAGCLGKQSQGKLLASITSAERTS
jgi:hypothetical protein